MKVTLPTVHLHGTSREELCRQLRRADAALLSAYGAVAATAPDGRDYFPQGDAAIAEAIKEHRNRLRRISDVRDEIITIWRAI
jgi:hypothetical protein